jgi:hypothetical protein
MDSLFSLLDNKDFDEPAEIAQIKKYIREHYGASVGVLVREKDIVISVKSAALANTLRLRSPEIKKRYKINKRFTFRIDG